MSAFDPLRTLQRERIAFTMNGGHPLSRTGAWLLAAALTLTVVAAYFIRILWWEIDPPERGLIGRQILSDPVDVDCVKQTLRREFGDVHHYAVWEASLPEGEADEVFDYYASPSGRGSASLGVARLSQGIRISHMFIGHGHKLPQSDFPPALAAMKKATDALLRGCQLDLSEMKVREMGQRVAALH